MPWMNAPATTAAPSLFRGSHGLATGTVGGASRTEQGGVRADC
jgi:hypothetical protein